MEQVADMQEEVEAVIHSLGGKIDAAIILSHKDNNHCLAEYKGEICTAVWNPYSGYYYVDDVYGKVRKVQQASRNSENVCTMQDKEVMTG